MRTKIVSIAWLTFLVFGLVLTASAEPPLRFARIENIPDQFIGGEILKAVYGHLNIPIELVDLPAKRALVDSSEGRLDGEVQRNIKVQAQYPTLVMIRPAINYIEPSVFSKKERFAVKGWQSVSGYNIGIVRGVGTSEDGTRGMKSVQAVSTMDQLMLMVAEDRVDVAISDSFSGLAVIKRLGLEDRVTLLTPPLQKNEIYHFLHEKHRDLVPKVERVISEMQASGELERLRKKTIETYLSQLKGPPHGK